MVDGKPAVQPFCAQQENPSYESEVWNYFTKPTLAQDAPEKRNQKWTTNCCLCLVAIKINGQSTTNLIRHVESHWVAICKKNTEKLQKNAPVHIDQPQAKQPKSGGSSPAEILEACSAWLINEMRAFSTVEGMYFKQFVHALNPNWKVPDWKTLNSFTLQSYLQKKAQLGKLLQMQCLQKAENPKPLLCCTLDGWSRIDKKGFMSVTGLCALSSNESSLGFS